MKETPLLVQLALRVGGLAFVAVGGGNALIPALHEQAVLSLHTMTEARFAQAVALSQAAPGPNMLLIPLIGHASAGIPGAAVALIAFLLPSATIAVLGSRFLVAHAAHPSVAAFRWALRPVSSGLMLSAAIVLMRTALRTWPYRAPAPELGFAAIALAVAVLASRVRVNPLLWLASAACIGAIVGP